MASARPRSGSRASSPAWKGSVPGWRPARSSWRGGVRGPGGGVGDGGAGGGAVPEGWVHRGPGRDRAPGDVSLRLHLPPAVRPGAAPLSGGALRARSRGPPHHRPLRALRGRHGGAREGGDPAMGGGLSGGLDLNGRALEIADRMATNAEALRVSLRTLPGGARVIDAGIETPGGYGAGLALAEICMGGLGHVDYAPVVIGDDHWAGVRVWTDHPA